MGFSFRKRLIALTLTVILASAVIVVAGDDFRLRARLTARPEAGDVSGKADYSEEESGRREFSVEIEGFTPGDVFRIAVAGVVVGTVEINAFGVGELDFDDTAQPDDEDEPFPPNFPALSGGELVRVGPLRGRLQPR
jgi:hypothetical protein